VDHRDKAVACFKETFNCAQSVLAAYCEELGLDKGTALKIATGFGGGMGSMGEVCGAVTGAFMVISLKYGRTKADDLPAKEKTAALVQEFTRRFKEKNRTISCRQLLGCDLTAPSGKKEAQEKGLYKTLCAPLVADAAEILEDIL
jgi:C_GCAxxG_C_C family probable redox protein